MNIWPLSKLEDNLWDLIGKQSEPRFVMLDDSPLSQRAFLRLVAYGHPYFGRAFFACVGKGYESLRQKLLPAISMGLISLEIVDHPVYCPGWFHIASEGKNNGGIDHEIDLLLVDDVEDSTLTGSDYPNLVATLSLYGKTLGEFVFPRTTPAQKCDRDWHYFGPFLDQASYDADKDEILLGLWKNEGPLCPEDSYAVFRRFFGEEDVSGEELYHAIRQCYAQECILRDMAAYQHETWCLRTLCFHEDRAQKADFIIPYPDLLDKELKNLDGLEDSKAFPNDILYSDFLTPLWYLRKLWAQFPLREALPQ